MTGIDAPLTPGTTPGWRHRFPFQRGRRPSACSPVLPLLVEEVDEDVVAERLGGCEEGSLAIHLHHPLDELAQVEVVLEHEGVDADAVLRAPLDLAQGHLDRQR